MALIRKSDRLPEYPDGEVICFGVDTRDAWLGFRVLDRIEDSVMLDPRDRAAFPGDPEGEPLFLVCTHGRRDPCCAEQGRPLAARLQAEFRDVTWESTLVGGDRFAANLVAFPHGLYFGRVEADEGPEIVLGYAQGRIARLSRYRGRSSDPREVQAAERTLREQLSVDRIDDLRLVRRRRSGDAADVVFATPRGEVRVRLERVPGASLRLTCSSTQEEAPRAWRTVALELVDG